MYICNCNGLTEGQIENAATSGDKHWRDVLARHGYEPCCGMCETEITDLILQISNEIK